MTLGDNIILSVAVIVTVIG